MTKTPVILVNRLQIKVFSLFWQERYFHSSYSFALLQMFFLFFVFWLSYFDVFQNNAVCVNLFTLHFEDQMSQQG